MFFSFSWAQMHCLSLVSILPLFFMDNPNILYSKVRSTILKEKRLENNRIGNSSRYSEIPLIYDHILGAKKFCRTWTLISGLSELFELELARISDNPKSGNPVCENRIGADSDFVFIENCRIGADSDFRNFKHIRIGADSNFRFSKIFRIGADSDFWFFQNCRIGADPDFWKIKNLRIGADSDFWI